MATAVTASATAATRFTRLAGAGLLRSSRSSRRLPTAVRFQRPGLTTTALLRATELKPKDQGQPETLDYRVFLVDGAGRKMSPWHDVPLRAGDGVFHFIVEIPKESSAKMEVATDEAFTPIKQDTKKGNLRYYPYNINWNYGLLPQTWEDPTAANADVEGALGDNDPVDVVEIGERRANIGDVLRVKPLASLAMIDEGELDWKIVAISLDDPKASLVNDVDDVEKHFPLGSFKANPLQQTSLHSWHWKNGYGNIDCYQRLVQRLQDTRWKARQQIWPWQQAHKRGICSEGHTRNQ